MQQQWLRLCCSVQPRCRSERAAVLAQLQAAGYAPSNFVDTAIDSNFPNPYSMQWTVYLQRQLAPNLVLSTAYIGNHALKIPMIRTQNLPDRITGLSPVPTLGQFTYFDDSDASSYEAWQTSLRKTFSNGLTVAANYTLARNIAYTDGNLLPQTPPQDNNNLRADLGPTPFAIRNNFNAHFVYQVPLANWARVHGRSSRLLLDGWQLSGVFSSDDGMPLAIINGNSAYPSDRPDLVAGSNPVFDNYTSTLQYLNLAAFSAVPIINASGAQVRPGILGRNQI